MMIDTLRRKLIRKYCLVLLVLLTYVSAATAGADEQVAIELQAVQHTAGELSSHERLYRLLDIMWTWQMENYPELATFSGYRGQDDRWRDDSLDAIERRKARQHDFLDALSSIDRETLDESATLDYDLVRKALEQEIEGHQFPSEYLPLNQMNGVHINVERVIGVMPSRTVEDYENIVRRLRAVPRLIDQAITLLQQGLAAGVTPPRVTLRDVPQQIVDLLADDISTSPLMTSFERFPRLISADDQQRLRTEAEEATTQIVYPAFRRLHDFLVETYIPAARTSIGHSELPRGEAWYAYNVRQYTTTDLTPREIHDIGKREVERILKEMESVKREAGFAGNLPEFLTFVRTNPEFFFDDPDDLLKAYRAICKRADAELIKLFKTLPRLPYGVQRVPSYSEKSQTTAYYRAGSIEAGRPGYFFANTYDLKSRPKWEMEALSLHEAVPGHHLQIAIARERPGLHDIRKYQNYTAFIEGWALYAESLGEEMGFYQDPYSKFGQLTYEIWRAIRLVVDTGMHSLGWTRQQAIEFFQIHAGKAAHDIVVEVDRYIVWPGQALAYKIGELKIKELRANAEQQLGPNFDIREFHDAVLANGALPLDVLETQIRKWVAVQEEESDDKP